MAGKYSVPNHFDSFDHMIDNKDCAKIISLIGKRFEPYLEEDDIKSLSMQAAWTAYKTYDESKMKFTSYLYSRVSFKLRAALFKSKKKYLQEKSVKEQYILEERELEKDKNLSIYTDIMNGLEPEDKALIEKRFIENMTNLEISKLYNVTPETVRGKIARIINRCKRQYA